jgi:hypothetical protein
MELKKDLNQLSGVRNALRRQWETYLKGKKPNHPLTFDPETASEHRDCLFITALHPLARQAAAFWQNQEEVYLCLKCASDTLSPGEYPFLIYTWRYTGFQSYTRLVPICENEALAAQLSELMELAESGGTGAVNEDLWSGLEQRQARLWKSARDQHKQEVDATLNYRIESLTDLHNSFVRSRRQQIRDTENERLRRMWEGELRDKSQRYEYKIQSIRETGASADIFSSKLMKGIITIVEES